MSCFPTISLNRTKLKYGTLKLKAYEIKWMIELGAIFFLGPKGSLLVHLSVQSECTLGCTSCGLINDRLFQTNPLKGTILR